MSSPRLRLAIAVALFSPLSFAITDEEGTAGMQFNFSNPGARSLSMAGAFVALADDATAAYANPAGLTQLSRREFSAEGRYYDYSTPHLSNGRLPTDGSFRDVLSYGASDSSASGAAFLSMVFPFEQATLAIYRHEVMDFNTRFAFETEGINPAAFKSDIDLKDVSYGVSTAVALGERLRLGAGIVWHEFSIDSRTVRDTGFGSTSIQTQKGKDRGLGYILGMRYLITEDLSVGAVYRRSPRLRYQARNLSFDPNFIGPEPVEFMRKQSDFDMPDVWGVGLSYRFNEAFTVNLDVNRIRYSQLTRNITSAFDATTASDAPLSTLKLSDGTEIRVGGEYVFVDLPVPLSIRAGVWRDPEHTIHYHGDDPDSIESRIFSASTGDQTHYTFGMGLAFERFSIDFGADLSKYYDTYSLAAVARF